MPHPRPATASASVKMYNKSYTKRDSVVPIRLSSEERKRILKAAKEAGISFSGYIRSQALMAASRTVATETSEKANETSEKTKGTNEPSETSEMSETNENQGMVRETRMTSETPAEAGPVEDQERSTPVTEDLAEKEAAIEKGRRNMDAFLAKHPQWSEPQAGTADEITVEDREWSRTQIAQLKQSAAAAERAERIRAQQILNKTKELQTERNLEPLDE